MSGQIHKESPRKNMQNLQKALKAGSAVVSELWSYSTGDWVSSVHAADIDGDGDIEVLLGSRDCNAYILTKRGAKKSRLRLSNEWVGTVRGVNDAEASDSIRLIAGSRDKTIQALDKNGHILWHFPTQHVVRQVRINDINRDGKTEVLVGSEDGFVYVLRSEDGAELWRFPTNDWVRAVHAADIDGDGEIEILVGSGDKNLYILDNHGQLKQKHDVHSKIYSIFADDIDGDGEVEILVSSDMKELNALTPSGERKWQFVSNSRILSLSVADLNNDGYLEIIAASEDKHIYFLNNQGTILWKHNLGSRVFSVFVCDIDNDGIMEVLAGTEDSIRVLRLELASGLYDKIAMLYKKLGEPSTTQLGLLAQEAELLQDMTNVRSYSKHQLTMQQAATCMQQGDYLNALSILVLLDKQKVQTLWSEDIGHVRSVYSGDLNNDGQVEIVAGTEQGNIYVLDTNGKRLWEHGLKTRIWTVYVGDIDLDGVLEIVAGSADGQLYVFSNTGDIKWQPKLDNGVESVYVNEEPDLHYAEIVIGLRGQNQGKIHIYDNHFSEVIPPIVTDHGIRVVATKDLDGDGKAEIIAAGDNDTVYVYSRDGQQLWFYKTGDRARGLSLHDIDDDGCIEIIVGSEDRNIHVLDSKGHLKWRYCTPHRVLSVNTLDINQDGEVEVFLGTDDGYVYFLSKTGDLLWKYSVDDRVRGVQAGDFNQDDKIEIIVGSEDRMLYLLQVLNPHEVSQAIEQCWLALQSQGSKSELLHTLTHEEAHLRAFAIARMITQDTFTERDTGVIQKHLHEPSSEVHAIFAQEMARLYQTHPHQFRRSMDILLEDERDVKLALVESLPALTQLDVYIGFQYLERLSNDFDKWVRQAVVRKLYQIMPKYSQKVFPLLLSCVYDEAEWVRQEVARTLAHYFDFYTDDLLNDARKLLSQSIAAPAMLEIIELIAYRSTQVHVQSIFLVYAHLFSNLDEQNIQEKLASVVKAFKETLPDDLEHGNEMWQVYQELSHLHSMRTIHEIARYKCSICQTTALDMTHFEEVRRILRELTKVASILALYLRREHLGDSVASLLEAIATIETISAHLTRELAFHQEKKLLSPDRLILELLLSRWRTIVASELSRLRGKADLKAALRSTYALHEEQVVIWLDTRNGGRSPADNVSVTLQQSDLFEIVGEHVRQFEMISASSSVVAEFTIRPKTSSLHFLFNIVYADAESKEKALRIGEKLELHKSARSFETIRNPYSVGTPIQTQEMFFGRQEDLERIKDDLMYETANMVVVLYGQRRSGKSSLLYQLLHHLNDGSHIPMYIDMQHEKFDLKTGRLLHRMASAIHWSLCDNNLIIAEPDEQSFVKDPTSAFDNFLNKTEAVRGQHKLIIMIDEFDVLEQGVIDKVLPSEIFEYLRSLMQHRRGINFLLSGTHKINQLTAAYSSVFFNIAHHYRLARLSEQASEALIRQPVKGVVEYDDLAVAKIRQLAADQPYFIQLICYSLIIHCNMRRKSYVTVNDVNIVLDRVMETGQVHFEWLWTQLPLQERLVLSIIAQEGGDEGKSLSPGDIKEVYHNFGLSYDHKTVLDALESLVRADIAASVSEATRFKVPTGLLHRWLRETKRLKRVLLEENLLL